MLSSTTAPGCTPAAAGGCIPNSYSNNSVNGKNGHDGTFTGTVGLQ
jgi:hypothetical protein